MFLVCLWLWMKTFVGRLMRWTSTPEQQETSISFKNSCSRGPTRWAMISLKWYCTPYSYISPFMISSSGQGANYVLSGLATISGHVPGGRIQIHLFFIHSETTQKLTLIKQLVFFSRPQRLWIIISVLSQQDKCVIFNFTPTCWFKTSFRLETKLFLGDSWKLESHKNRFQLTQA